MDASLSARFPEDTFKEHQTPWGTVDMSIDDGKVHIYFNHEETDSEPSGGPWFTEGALVVSITENNADLIMYRIKSAIEIVIAQGETAEWNGLTVQSQIASVLREQGVEVDSGDIEPSLEA